MDKKTILAIVLSFIILIGWQYMFPAAPLVEESNTAQDNITQNSNNISNTSTPVEVSSTPQQSSIQTTQNTAPVILETDKIKVTFNSVTGNIMSASVLGWNDEDGDRITFNKNGNDDYAKILTGIVGIDGKYSAVQENTSNGYKVSFVAETESYLVTKTYEVSNGSYLVNTNVKIVNKGKETVQFPLTVAIGPNLGQGFAGSSYVFQGAMIGSPKGVEKVKLDDDDAEVFQNPQWAAYTSKYFLFAARSDNAFTNAEIKPVNNSPVAYISSNMLVNPASSVEKQFDFYVGPKYYEDLKALGMQKTMDYGMFYFLAIPMLYTLNYSYDLVANYGIAIIILTFIVKLLIFPLTYKGMKASYDMSKLRPELQKLNAKFKDEPQKLQQATMELYREHKVNPLSGCFPLLLQLPIFLALYNTINVSFELNGAPFALWLTDLSHKDPYYILPVLMGALMFLQQKLTPMAVTDPVQKKIFLFMPIMFAGISINFPAGLVLYWIVNTIFTIIPQVMFNKKYPLPSDSEIEAQAKKTESTEDVKHTGKLKAKHKARMRLEKEQADKSNSEN